MATLPYIQLYVADYLADTQHLSAEEHGAYLLLIMNYWQTEKPIPQNRLQGITRMFNDRWTSVKQNLNEFFLEDENGDWFHERIYKDLEKVKQKSIQASEAGKKSAIKRAVNKGDSNDRSTTVQQKSNDRLTIEDKREKIKDTIMLENEFQECWKLYTLNFLKKQGRGGGSKTNALAKYISLRKKHSEEDIRLLVKDEMNKSLGHRDLERVLTLDNIRQLKEDGGLKIINNSFKKQEDYLL